MEKDICACEAVMPTSAAIWSRAAVVMLALIRVTSWAEETRIETVALRHGFQL